MEDISSLRIWFVAINKYEPPGDELVKRSWEICRKLPFGKRLIDAMLPARLCHHLQGRIPAGRGPKVKPRSSWFCGGRDVPCMEQEHDSSTRLLSSQRHLVCGEHQYISRRVCFFSWKLCLCVVRGLEQTKASVKSCARLVSVMGRAFLSSISGL